MRIGLVNHSSKWYYSHMKISESRHFIKEYRKFRLFYFLSSDVRNMTNQILNKEDPHGIWTAKEDETSEEMQKIMDNYFSLHTGRVYFKTRCPYCGKVSSFSCEDRPRTGILVKKYHCQCGFKYIVGTKIINETNPLFVLFILGIISFILYLLFC